ncbi:hypothetical protein KC327_g91 [Hortaea werneckii]|nr:hypothetical protein KC327_g91 [Hortaea werneckii]
MGRKLSVRSSRKRCLLLKRPRRRPPQISQWILFGPLRGGTRISPPSYWYSATEQPERDQGDSKKPSI